MKREVIKMKVLKNSMKKIIEVSLEKEENTILIFTTEKSLSVKTGDSMWLAFGLLDTEANQFSEWKKMAIVV